MPRSRDCILATESPESWFNHGVSCMETGDYRGAENCFRRVRSLAPESLEALLNLGYVLDKQGRYDDALDCYEDVLAISPENSKAHYNRAIHRLRAGDLSAGFADYEARFAAIKNADNRHYTMPRWDGSPLNRRSILVYCEQGLGDAIQFSRYIPILASRGGRVLLEVQLPLLNLFSTLPGVEQIVLKTDIPPAADCYIPLLSLPHLFKTTIDTIPATTPYLLQDSSKTEAWAQTLAADRSYRVGIVWSGSASNPMDRERSCPLSEFVPLLTTQDASYYSLQVGPASSDLGYLPYDVHLKDLTKQLTDFSDTAALIANLDLVITVDTAVAHLAGALGKPVWLLLANCPDWRWMMGREDSPWYPTMRLFRQQRPGDWKSVVGKLVGELQKQLALQSHEPGTSDEILENSFREALGSIAVNELDAAASVLERLARHLPRDPAVWFNLGRVYAMKNQFSEAEHCYRQALLLDSDSPAIWFGLGDVCLKQKKYPWAEVNLRRAHELNPGSVDILLDLGAALVQLDNVQEAFECCRKILDIKPDCAEAIYNMAYLQLRTGDYKSGFTNFEARLLMKNQLADNREYIQPRWDGSALNGRSILVYGEQGMGDVIQFARYIPLIVERGGIVTFEVDPPLLPLFEQFPGVAKLVRKSGTPPLTDVYIQSLSLPYIFGTTIETVPNRIPYIFPDSRKVEQWRQRLAGYEPAFRIGLVWRGNSNNPLDQIRSCPLSEFSQLATVDGVQFFSLQVGAGKDEAINTTGDIKLIDHTDQLHDFSDTAAFISNLDLIVGVDTAVTHLAGAMGKQVWLVLPHVYDWRWLTGRDDSPWYPSLRVFWQHRHGDWTSSVTSVKNALGERLIRKNNPTEDIEVCYGLGVRLKEDGDLVGAEGCFRKVVEQYPDLPDPQHSLGVVLQLQGRLQEAIGHYKCAIYHDPGFVKAHYNLANAYLKLGLYKEALAAVHQVIRHEPAHADAHWLLGMLLLQSGDFKDGWREYEWRWKAQGFTSRIPELGRPQWDGTPLSGKTLLIHMEQGRGDMIQFIRYASLVAAAGGTVVACALPELVSILATVEGISLVVDRNGTLPNFDLHIPVQSLPYVFGTTLDSIPANMPYLHPSSESVAEWARRLDGDRQGFRIGLVWAGNEQPNANRSCPLEYLTPLLGLPDTVFYSLQIGKQENSRLTPACRDRIIDHTAAITDFSDTAAMMSNLDLVISIDTASAHLAGALGQPVWTLLPFVADWRWLLTRDDSPWYQSMKLFRQETHGDWAAVIDRLRHELSVMLSRVNSKRVSGVSLLRSGQASEAEKALVSAVAENPADAEALCNLGVAIDTQGRHEEAAHYYREALSCKPDFMQAAFNLGNACRAMGKLDNARFSYEHVIELSPDFVPAYLSLGEIGKALKDFEGARINYERALHVDPNCVDAIQGIAEVLQAEERYEEAINGYKMALAIEPSRISALNMLGTAYQSLEMLEEAAKCYRQALSLLPDRPTVLNNLGVVLTSQGRLIEAVEVFQHLVDIEPEYAEGHWNLSVALLASGAYKDGWREFEWRFRKSNPVPERLFSQPRWDGSALNGKTILLHAEQGFGDTIQFVRYVPRVAELGGRVVIECQVAALRELLLSLDGVAQVVVAGEPLPDFDCHLPLMSLPLEFGTTLETIPSQVPYLAASSDKVKEWRNRLGVSKKMRVGLVWFAKQSQVLNRKRSCPLRMFAPLWAVPDVEFYSLQIGVGVDQLDEFKADYELFDLTSHIKDFSDTAAFMANLDLVITIDTVTAHLAGALHVRTWVVLPKVAEWRWLSNRGDSPWYPDMRLFRQPTQGDWSSLMNNVASELQLCAENVLGNRNVRSVCFRPWVGLAWSGRQDNPINCKRSCPFSALAPLFELNDITFVKLQMDSADGLGQNMVDVTDQIRDFEDTAALMANLDLIISIDTSVAHLAAASGRPTWLLLPHVADWRWSKESVSSPWYPEVKLFRQPDHGDWDSVIREVAHRLKQFSNNTLDWESSGGLVFYGSFSSKERKLLESLLEKKHKKLALNVASPDDRLDVGTALALLGRHSEAIEVFRQVLALDPEHVAGHLNLAYSLLAMGEYPEGWHHFEWRLKRLQPGQIPPWPMLGRNELGKHETGTSLLVHCEQGFGDTIQFSRFLPLLADAGYRVIVSCQPPMARLVSTINGVSRVVSHGEALPECCLQVLLLSLPWLFCSTLGTLPINIPYLSPRQKNVEYWKGLLEEKILHNEKKN
ncbi:MAG: tetratricopeptide repeat protein [Geobacteraceae bacterium]|nr:tetratricopeptide repeat protein [Geobacteraceae bacterium]